MRLVQVLIPEGSQSDVLSALDDEEIDYVVWEETGRGDFEALVSFPVPETGVEPVLDRLYAAGIKEDSYTIVMSTETVVSEKLGGLKERYSGYGISRDELVARSEDLAPAASTFFIFLTASTLIATTGLLLDSAATIIGAMVIALLMGSAISASVGAVLANSDMASRGVTLQVTGLLAAVATAAVFGLLLKDTVLLPPVDIRTIPQILKRTTPNFLSLFLALGSGIAGAVSIMRGQGRHWLASPSRWRSSLSPRLRVSAWRGGISVSPCCRSSSVLSRGRPSKSGTSSKARKPKSERCSTTDSSMR